jgi:serine/threonine protein kinase
VSEQQSPPDGEKPGTLAEDRLGRFLESALDKLGAGEPIVVEELLADRPDLLDDGNALLRDLLAVRGAVKPADQPVAPPRPPTPPPAGGLPQPFPDDFLVTDLLGEGSYGKVWLAEDLHLPRQVALKGLRFAADSEIGAATLAALKKEAGFLTEIRHPNVVQVLFWRQAGGQPYLVLEFVSGGSLAGLVKKEPLPWDRAARYVADVAQGLLAVHAKGVIHRDIKPANILWDKESDEAKLTDFGVAGRLAEARTVTGTRAYMAPEVFSGRASEASDVYGLSATLFRLVAGEVPFRADDPEDQVRLIERGLPPDDTRFSGLPARLEEVIREGLAPLTERRPALREFADRLRGGLNQSLVDDVAGVVAGGGLRLVVSRQDRTGTWRPLAATHQPTGGRSRDMRKVPREPDRVQVRTGEWVRIEVTSDRDGFVTVFNVGPSGNLNLLHPDHPAPPDAPPDVRAGKPLLISDVVFDPPSGRERLFAVWSPLPLPLTERDLRSLVTEKEAENTRSYRASRDMKRVKQVVLSGESRVVALELEHNAS